MLLPMSTFETGDTSRAPEAEMLVPTMVPALSVDVLIVPELVIVLLVMPLLKSASALKVDESVKVVSVLKVTEKPPNVVVPLKSAGAVTVRGTLTSTVPPPEKVVEGAPILGSL